MKNQEIAKIFYEIADFLEMDKVNFKPYAYKKAAAAIESLEKDVTEIYQTGGKKALLEITGIGKSMAEHIEEYLKTGQIKEHEKFKKRLPLRMDELTKVEGLGPRKIKILYQKLGVNDLQSLEKAAKFHKIAPLFGFGEKTEKNILQGIDFLKRDKGRFLISEILPFARQIQKELENREEVKKISLAGSIRRGKETIGDIDFLAVSKNSLKTMNFFASLSGVEKIWGKGGTKTSVRMKNGFDMDLRIVPAKSYGAALQYFTGSKEHNIAIRKIAMDKGLKLSEYGLFKGKKLIASYEEEDIYKTLGMQCPPPEIRENNGEINAALRGQLPKLVELKDIKGDLHIHSNWKDPRGGKDSIEDLVKYALFLGYEYIGISDHTKDLKIEKGLNEKELLAENEFIKKLNEKFKDNKFRILHGCEANIRKDGSIDIDDKVLARLDYVIAGVHSFHKLDKTDMTARIKRAMQNPHVDILAHPTGRIVGKRGEYLIDISELIKTAKDTNTILEINASERLDLRDIYIRQAKKEGIKMIINTDAHKKEQMNLMEYGVLQARRGWAEKDDIINTLSSEKLLEYFK